VKAVICVAVALFETQYANIRRYNMAVMLEIGIVTRELVSQFVCRARQTAGGKRKK